MSASMSDGSSRRRRLTSASAAHVSSPRNGSVAGVAIAGTLLAVAGVLLHRHVWPTSVIDIPWGAGLAVAAVAVRCRVIRHEDNVGRRCGLLALTWLVVTTCVALLRTDDLLVASDYLGVGYLLGGALIIGTCATWPTKVERQRWAAFRR